MNITSLIQPVTQVASRTMLVAQKYAPEILTGVGVVGVVATAVLAGKSTIKAAGIVDEFQTQQQMIEAAREQADLDRYSQNDYRKDKITTVVNMTKGLLVTYTPAIIVGGITIACFLGSTKILRGRNAALMAAYKLLDAQYKKYRARVAEEHGVEEERRLYSGVDHVYKKKDGEKKLDEVKAYAEGLSPYARIFDEMSPYFERNAYTNMTFLRGAQQMFNDKLKARGHVFLNEVYDHLGFPRTSAGAVVGWVYDSKGEGDEFIDFGLYNFDAADKRNFLNAAEKSIWLDFNVDGTIYDKI